MQSSLKHAYEFLLRRYASLFFSWMPLNKFTRRERSHDCHRRRLKGFTWILLTLACHEKDSKQQQRAELSRSPHAGPPQNGILGNLAHAFMNVTLTYLSFSLWFRAQQLESLLLGSHLCEMSACCRETISYYYLLKSHRKTAVVLFDSNLYGLIMLSCRRFTVVAYISCALWPLYRYVVIWSASVILWIHA